MDFEQNLINEVQLRPVLYDRYMLGHRCRQKKTKAWMSISMNIGQPVPKCKKRWRSLRDRYYREIKKNSNNQLVWKYYPLLDFLKNYMKIPNIESRPDTTNPELFHNHNHHHHHNHKDEIPKLCTNTYSSASTTTTTTANTTTNNNVLINDLLKIDYNNQLCYNHDNENIRNVANFHNNYDNHVTPIETNNVKVEITENTIQNFIQTLTNFQQYMKGTIRNENGSFGSVVADMLTALPLQMRAKAKVHIMQYLSELQLQCSNNITTI